MIAICSMDSVDNDPFKVTLATLRISPEFARDAIRAFSKPGDTILDPFWGGRTSLIEGVSPRVTSSRLQRSHQSELLTGPNGMFVGH